MSDNDTKAVRRGLSRRRFLQGSAAFGTAAAFGGFPAIIRAANTRGADTPLRHVVISMQENRSFDHYFGYAPWSAPYGPPPGYSQPDGPAAGRAIPIHEPRHAGRRRTTGTPSTTSGTAGQWTASTRPPASRAWATTRRPSCPFYYSLFDDSTLCVNYFCSLLGPTWPNRFYLAAGTSGGITTNGVWGYGDLRLPDDPRPARRGRRDVEGLQHRLGQRALRQHRQRRSSSGSDTRTTAGRAAARAPTSTTFARVGCRRCRSSSRAMPGAGTSIRRPTSRSAWGSRRS